MPKIRKAAKTNVFVFDKYVLNRAGRSVSFFYRLERTAAGTEPIAFEEKISFPEKKINWDKVNEELLNRLLFDLHLALGVSYYKTYCPEKIVLEHGSLSSDEAAFWNKLYTKGLGEFFYKNKIDFRGLIRFPVDKKKTPAAVRVELKERCLLPWGGGKESIVSGEKLKALGHDFALISLGDSEAQQDTAQVINKSRFIFERRLDKGLFALNKEGAMNGHVPISSIYSFVALLAAVLYDYKYVVFSNEASANFGNVEYLGNEINHQYSKSLEFENDLRDHLARSLSPDLDYFSLLRPYSEFRIAAEFVSHPEYFSSFVSCNRQYALNQAARARWCGRCPKCAFVFSQLAAYLPKETVVAIFNKDLFADAALLPLFQELWGEKRFKPFECVGDAKEVSAALAIAAGKPEWQNGPVTEYFLKNRLPKIKNANTLVAGALKISPEHNVPLDFQKILILGFNHEGRAAARYLSRLYPTLKFSIADAKKIDGVPKQAASVFFGADYLQAIYEADLIIKTPGVSDRLPEIAAAAALGQKITGITDIFLAQAADRTIGVTGTKGKSTTASLIHKILLAGGIDAELVGNIGADPLRFLPDPDKIFVYELSSYQLSIAETSPHVAVFINIFPDHLPYHGGFDNYFAAKTNIVKNQKTGDIFIYNSDHALLKKLAAAAPSKKIDYLKKGSIVGGWLCYGGKKTCPLSEIRLLGRHNIENIFAAIAAAKLYGVKDAAIRAALKNFTNLKHRLDFVGRYRDLDFYDDAISTTPESTLAGISVFEDRLGAIILGGEDRGYDFNILAKKLVTLQLDALVFLPESGAKIFTAMKKAARNAKTKLPPSIFTSQMDEAVKFCYGHAQPGKVCLLSTASPSYTLFKNFEDKGDRFQEAVKRFA
jgi:UDP-N-acetylmuramoylalanine--D-glutamate ligase